MKTIDMPPQASVLDKGHVRLVDVMPRLSEDGTADYAVVQSARVSYGLGTKTPKEDRDLIRYLFRHRHTTPVEMIETKWHVKCPLYVARQWVRHRTASCNEVSGRYTEFKDEFQSVPPEEVRRQSKSNKQGSDGLAAPTVAAEFSDFVEEVAQVAFAEYTQAIADGVAKEQARINLPLTLYTEFYWKIDLHNLLHFLALRCDKHAQLEIRVYADAMLDAVRSVAPVCVEAFDDYHPMRGAMLLSRLEVEALRSYMITGHGHIRSDNRRECDEWIDKLMILSGSKTAVN